MNNQRELWDKNHQEGNVDHVESEPTDFGREVNALISARSHILELGCGVGNDSAYFAQQGHSVVATDFSEVAIEKDRKRYQIPNLDFQVLDMQQPMEFLDSSFDVVYARLSLHYFKDSDSKRIFHEIQRILRPDGYLVFVCKSVNDPLYGKGKKIEEDMYNLDGHVRHFFSEDYARACLGENYHNVSIQSGEEQFYGYNSAFVKVIARKS